MSDAVRPVGPAADLTLTLEPGTPPSSSRGTAFSELLDRREPAPSVGDMLTRALKDAGRSLDEGRRIMDRAMRAARRSQPLSAADLLCLQAGVYKHTHTVELSSKLVDKMTSAVRHTLTSQQ